MTLLASIGFLLAAAGIFLLLNLSPLTFLDELGGLLTPRKKSIKKQIQSARNKNPPRGFRLLLLDTREILRVTGRSKTFSALCALSIFLFIAGALIAINLQNLLFVPVLAVGLALLPFWYVKLTASRMKKNLTAELETALSVVTSSYLRGNNTFIRAVEENLPYLNPPVAEVFRRFLLQTKLINSNIKSALEQMKAGIDNTVYREWVDAVIACQDDHTLKTTLVPIISKLSDIRVVTGELDLILFEPVKEYITMALLLVASIPLMYFLNQSWFDTLVNTGFGKALLAICAGVLFLSIGGVVRHTRPIEYKR